MIGEIDWFGQIVGGAADGEITANAKIAKALIRAGLGVVIIEPNGKKAVCILNEREKKAANIAAQDAARAKGAPNWERVNHECGIKHVITDEKVLSKTRVKYWLSQGANLAVAPGTGERRILIVDVDTSEEKRAFVEDWKNADSLPDGMKDSVPLTVSSPGVMDTSVGGEPVWTHKDGGHFWFSVPDSAELPDRPGKLTWCRCHGVRQPVGTCRNAWTAYYGSGYVLVPPSVRPEGAYRLTGAVHRAPEWLTDLTLSARASEREEGSTGALSALQASGVLEDEDPIDSWSKDHSWQEILMGDGFTPCDYDGCGCPTFTRPGSPVHTKSVTAHEFGCTKYDTSKGHGPLHIWSDALGTGTMSKISYIAKFHHEGNMGDAMRALGIQTLSVSDELSDFGDIPKDDASQVEAKVDEDRFAPIDWEELWDTEDDDAEYLPGMLLERGQQISLIGDGKSGKSLLKAEWCVKAITGQSFLNDATCDPLTIMYLDAENSRRDLKLRMKSLGATPEMLKGLIYLSFPPFKPLDSEDGAQQVMALVQKYQPDVVILDTVSRFIKGKENDSDTWLTLYRTLHKRLKALGISGIRLDHFGKDAEKGGRGSSAKSQDIDHVWELSVAEETENRAQDAIEVITFLELKRTHTRTGLGPSRMRIKRRGLKTIDEKSWLEGETSHRIADAFEGGATELTEIRVRPADMMRMISRFLEESEEGLSLRALRASITGDNRTIATALEYLEEEGYIKIEKKGRANVHVSVKAFEDESI